MRTRPFSPRPSRSTKPEETLDFKTQLEFGYNALKIPTFTPAPEPEIQQQSESGELTDTTAISGEVDSKLDGEDRNEEGKSQTETQPIANAENLGYNALKIPTFTPAPESQIQAKLGIGEVGNSDFQQANEQTPLANAESDETKNQIRFVIPLQSEGKDYDILLLENLIRDLKTNRITAKEILNTIRDETNSPDWIVERKKYQTADGVWHIDVTISKQLLQQTEELPQLQLGEFSIPRQLTSDAELSLINLIIDNIQVETHIARSILASILSGENQPWIELWRSEVNGQNGIEYVNVLIDTDLLKQYYADLSQNQAPLAQEPDVRTYGIVFNEEGVNLRSKPLTDSSATIIKKLPFNTKLFVDKALHGDWYFVTLTTGEYGYVAAEYIKTNLPEPGATLHKIGYGESASIIAQKYYGNYVEPGQDLRFYINVLVYANQGAGIYKPNPEASWKETITREGYLIWIPSVEFAQSLKGTVKSGSLTHDAWNQVKEIAIATGNFALGGGSFVAGLLHGALESLWDTLVGFKDLAVLAWEIVESLFKGTILADAQQLWETISKLDVAQLIEAGIEHLAEKWNQPDLLKRWHFRGWLCGYAIAELVMLVFSEGILTAIKGAAKAGKFSEILAKFPKVAELVEKTKTLGGEKVERLRVALKTSQPLLVARQWAANVLKIPAEILQDLSVEAIERLKQLPRWARDRFSELNHGAMRRVLGCASPCLVNLQEVQRYLKNLAADAVAGARRLITADDVINALPAELLNLTKLRKNLAKPELMNIIKRAELTDLDFAKMRDFVTRNLTENENESYAVFTRYLSAVVPSKIGPDLNKFIEFAEPMSGSAGKSFRGAMFENFAKLYLPELQGLERGKFKVPGYKDLLVNTDLFDTTNGIIWEFKYQTTKLPSTAFKKYVPIIGQRMIGTLYEAKAAHFVFPTEELARLNYANIKAQPAHKVFFLEQPSGQAIRLVELQ